MIVCDHCGKEIDRNTIDLGDQIQFAPGVDIHKDCRTDFMAAVQAVIKAPKPPVNGGK